MAMGCDWVWWMLAMLVRKGTYKVKEGFGQEGILLRFGGMKKRWVLLSVLITLNLWSLVL